MDWIYRTDDPLLQTLASTFIVFVLVIAITRIAGLRSFAKFTSYDFAFTIASGSCIAAILTSSTTIAHGILAVMSMLLLSIFFAFLEKKFPILKNMFSNKPLLLMDGDKILTENLKAANIATDQLIAKLREANVLEFDQVLAVILESTGDISVLHKNSSDSEQKLNERLLEGVRKKP